MAEEAASTVAETAGGVSGVYSGEVWLLDNYAAKNMIEYLSRVLALSA